MIRSILKALSDFFDLVTQANYVDDYLSRAVSREDLERRIRELQHKGLL